MTGKQVAMRYPTLEQRGERRGEQRGEQRGIRKIQMAYVEEMYGPAAAAAVEEFLDQQPTWPELTFHDLNELATMWKEDGNLSVWWDRHQSGL